MRTISCHRPSVLACLLSVALLAGLVSCASTPEQSAGSHAAWLAARLEAGDAPALARHSNLPFAFDREIVTIGEDTARLWQRLIASGLRLLPPDQAAVQELGPASAFAPGREIAVFFKKVLPPDARLVSLRDAKGRVFVFLLASDRLGQPRIYGMGGPR